MISQKKETPRPQGTWTSPVGFWKKKQVRRTISLILETPRLDETDASQRFYHRDANGALTWTAEGLRTFRRRFARFGIRIEALQTFADYQTAMQISATVFVADTLEQLGERAKGKPWRELLEAALLGDANARQRAQRRDARRQPLQLIGAPQVNEETMR